MSAQFSSNVSQGQSESYRVQTTGFLPQNDIHLALTKDWSIIIDIRHNDLHCQCCVKWLLSFITGLERSNKFIWKNLQPNEKLKVIQISYCQK